MYTQSPNEALVSRLLISWVRAELEPWGSRLFARDATLHTDGGQDADFHGPDEIIAQYLNPLRDEVDGESLAGGVEVAFVDAGATLSFEADGQRRELFLHVDAGKIDELWAYPAGAIPEEALTTRAAPEVGGGAGSSCCCGG